LKNHLNHYTIIYSNSPQKNKNQGRGQKSTKENKKRKESKNSREEKR
jgi:hypothetical protein